MALRLGGGAVLLWGLLSLAGLALTHPLSAGRLHSADLFVDTWLAAHRTPALNAATFAGASLAQTLAAAGHHDGAAARARRSPGGPRSPGRSRNRAVPRR